LFDLCAQLIADLQRQGHIIGTANFDGIYAHSFKATLIFMTPPIVIHFQQSAQFIGGG